MASATCADGDEPCGFAKKRNFWVENFIEKFENVSAKIFQ